MQKKSNIFLLMAANAIDLVDDSPDESIVYYEEENDPYPHMIEEEEVELIKNSHADDDREEIEWLDEIILPQYYQYQNYKLKSRTLKRGIGSVRWIGPLWNLLYVFEVDGKNPIPGIGIYVGFDNKYLLPVGWSYTLGLSFSIFDKNDQECDLRSHDRFQRNPEVFSGCQYDGTLSELRGTLIMRGETPRDDRGFKNMIQDVEYFNENYVRQREVNGESQFYYKIKVKLVLVPSERRMGSNWDSKLNTGMVGIENLGATCYLNSLLQMLYHITAFRRAVYSLPVDGEEYQTSMTLAMQHLFRNLQCSQCAATTEHLTRSFGWSTAEAFTQQDVQEMMRVLLDKLEEKMKNTELDGVISNLFAGKVKSYISCTNVSYESTREEDFYDIQLDVKGCADIHDSFKKYVAKEMLDGENQYDAGVHGKQNAEKGVIFTKFPPVLTIHLKRFEFDYNTMRLSKVHDHFEFPLRLNLDNYLASDCNNSGNDYILHSVLVHAGDVGGGHYYAYIRPSNEQFDYNVTSLSADEIIKRYNRGWYKFNDEIVSKVMKLEAVDHTYGRKKNDFTRLALGSAYMLVYIKESTVHDIMRLPNEEDLPRQLVQRLDEEELKQLKERQRIKRSAFYRYVYYFTEKSIQNFNLYSVVKLEDFIMPPKVDNDYLVKEGIRRIKCLKGSTLLNHLFSICKQLNIPPYLVRLWKVEPCVFLNTDYLWRVKGCVTLSHLRDARYSAPGRDENLDEYNEIMYFVEVLKPIVAINNAEWTQFMTWKSAEDELVEAVRKEVPPLDEDIDPLEGMGVGSNMQPLELYFEKTPDLLENSKSGFERLHYQVMNELADSCNYSHSDYHRENVDIKIIFIKIYDASNVFPSIKVLDYDVGSAVLGSNEGVDSKDLDEPTFAYNPVKYIGKVILHATETSADFKVKLFELLRAIECTNPSDIAAVKDYFDCPENFQYIVSKPAIYGYMNFDIDTDDSVQGMSMGSVLVMSKNCDEEVDMHPPFGVVGALSWMEYTIQFRDIEFAPADERDTAILQEWKLANEQTLGKRDHDNRVIADKNGNNSMETDGAESLEVVLRAPGHANVLQFLQYASEHLQLPLTQLIFYIVKRTAKYVSRDDDPFVGVAEPIKNLNCMHDNTDLGLDMDNLVEFIAVFKGKKSSSKFFYNISPFSLWSSAKQEDLRFTHRFMEIFITDERVRAIRREKLNHSQDAFSTGHPILSDYVKQSAVADEPSDAKRRKLVGGDSLQYLSTAPSHETGDDGICKVPSLFLDEKKVYFKTEIVSGGEISSMMPSLRRTLGVPLGEVVNGMDDSKYAALLNYAATSLAEPLENCVDFPLLLFALDSQDRSLRRIYSGDAALNSIMKSWIDSSVSPRDTKYACVQHAHMDDLIFMAGLGEVESMAVIVYNFTLGAGNVANLLEPSLFGGPFFTYVRIDDDYDSLWRRICELTGECETPTSSAKECINRLVCIYERIPFPLNKNVDENNSKTVWEVVRSKYSKFDTRIPLGKLNERLDITVGKSTVFSPALIPALGIQRSATSTSVLRYKKVSSSIHIK